VTPRTWLARMVIATWAGNIAIFTFLAPESLSAQAVHKVGPMGFLLLATLAFVSMMAIADNAVNDFLPERFQLFTKRYRHVGFMSMAIALVMLGGLVAIRTGATVVLMSYLLPAAFAVIVAWTDLFARRKEAMQWP
jgi:hypothetical protein